MVRKSRFTPIMWGALGLVVALAVLIVVYAATSGSKPDQSQTQGPSSGVATMLGLFLIAALLFLVMLFTKQVTKATPVRSPDRSSLAVGGNQMQTFVNSAPHPPGAEVESAATNAETATKPETATETATLAAVMAAMAQTPATTVRSQKLTEGNRTRPKLPERSSNTPATTVRSGQLELTEGINTQPALSAAAAKAPVTTVPSQLELPEGSETGGEPAANQRQLSSKPTLQPSGQTPLPATVRSGQPARPLTFNVKRRGIVRLKPHKRAAKAPGSSQQALPRPGADQNHQKIGTIPIPISPNPNNVTQMEEILPVSGLGKNRTLDTVNPQDQPVRLQEKLNELAAGTRRPAAGGKMGAALFSAAEGVASLTGSSRVALPP